MRRLVAILVCGFWMAFSGCSGDPFAVAPVTGKVMTCDGKPAAGGKIRFSPVDDPARSGRPSGQPGRISEGFIHEDGTFTLSYSELMGFDVGKSIDAPPGVLVGPHRVEVFQPITHKPVLTAQEKSVMNETEIKDFEAMMDAVKIHPQFPCGKGVEPDEVTVVSGNNHFEFKLSPK